MMKLLSLVFSLGWACANEVYMPGEYHDVGKPANLHVLNRPRDGKERDSEAYRPVELGEANFTQITQIGEGMTTGSWFIKFYAPWCGHCKRLAPIWEEVAPELKEMGVVTGSVNCVEQRKVCQRFSIQGYPTVLFFKDHAMYKFKGGRNAENLKNFVTEGYIAAQGYKIPPPPTLSRRMVRAFKDLLH